MNLTKKMFFLSAALTVLSSCKQDVQNPREIAQNYLSAFYSKDFNEAGKYVSTATYTPWQNFVNYLSENDNRYEISGVATIENVEVKDDFAVVYYFNINTLDRRDVIVLVRDNFEWKVNFERKDPIGVAENFLNAFHSGDLELAKLYATPTAQKDLDHLKAFYGKRQGPAVEIKDVEYNKEGDMAIVSYREEGSDVEKKINLRYLDWEWRVAFSKQDEWESRPENEAIPVKL